jgi:hypothetical protein
MTTRAFKWMVIATIPSWAPLACLAHDDRQLIAAMAIVFLLPVPAVFLLCGWRLSLPVLICLWLFAAVLLYLEPTFVRTFGVHLQSGLLSTLLLFSPNLALPFYFIGRYRRRKRLIEQSENTTTRGGPAPNRSAR